MNQTNQRNQRNQTNHVVNFGYRLVPEEEKFRYVLHHFDSIAGKYDWMNSLLSFGLHHWWKKQAVKSLELKAGDWVIDVCGGTADLAIRAAQAVGPTGRVVLYDINRAMMEAGRLKVSRAAAGIVEYVQGDAEGMAYPDGKFDAAMVGFGIRNLTHMEKGFQEMHRVLRPGGKLMVLEFSRPPGAFFRWLYDVYSFHLMPLAGRILAGSREAYTYLPESIRLFPLPEQLTAILEEIGFSSVTYQALTQGIAVIHNGIK